MKTILLAFFFSIVSGPCFAESAANNPFDSLLNWGFALAILGLIIGIYPGRRFIPHAPNVAPWNLYLGDQVVLLLFLAMCGFGVLKVFLNSFS